VPKAARGEHAAVVEVVDRLRVNSRRQGQRVADEAVLKLGDEVVLPAEALDLPRPKGEGGYGDKGCAEEELAVGAEEVALFIEQGCDGRTHRGG